MIIPCVCCQLARATSWPIVRRARWSTGTRCAATTAVAAASSSGGFTGSRCASPSSRSPCLTCSSSCVSCSTRSSWHRNTTRSLRPSTTYSPLLTMYALNSNISNLESKLNTYIHYFIITNYLNTVLYNHKLCFCPIKK